MHGIVDAATVHELLICWWNACRIYQASLQCLSKAGLNNCIASSSSSSYSYLLYKAGLSLFSLLHATSIYARDKNSTGVQHYQLHLIMHQTISDLWAISDPLTLTQVHSSVRPIAP